MYYINVELLRNHIYNNNYKLINMGDNALGFLIRLSKMIDEGIMKEV